MNPTYDFVIVGAGSAGCVLAARLSEDPSCRVLLLEAGGSDARMNVRIPAAFTKLFKTEVDWNYDTAPQGALGGRELYWPRGKMLGGCSSMNAQMYVRGNSADYDLWEDLGNPGWGFAGLRPYFDRLERSLRPERQRDPNPTTAAFLRAASETGIRTVDDVNGDTQEGAAYTRVTQRRGRRWSAADAYLRPAVRRSKNLEVLTGAHVTRIAFDGRRATRLEFVERGRAANVSCGEIILASGAVNSPQLLMLSGVGPARELRALGIEVAHDLPGVGHNLQDHLAFAVIAACSEPVTLVAAETVGNLLRFALLRRGMLTSNVGEACAFVKSRAELAAPDLELIFAPVPFVGHGLVRPTAHGITIGVVLLQPKSRGSVALRSADPRAAPLIRPEYLSHEDDLRTLAAGVGVAREIFRAPSFRRYAGDELQPAGDGVERSIRQHAETLYHPVGTCRMGADEMAVVDATLRVRGLEGLRVADCSVMPTIIRGHTHAPAVVIAEKAADMVRGRETTAIRAS